jgi:hypothetical protein
LDSLEDHKSILKSCNQIIRQYVLKFRGESLDFASEGFQHHLLQFFAVFGGERFFHPIFLLTVFGLLVAVGI